MHTNLIKVINLSLWPNYITRHNHKGTEIPFMPLHIINKHEKHEAKKDPEHACTQAQDRRRSGCSGGFGFHERHEKKETKKEEEESEAKKRHHFFG